MPSVQVMGVSLATVAEPPVSRNHDGEGFPLGSTAMATLHHRHRPVLLAHPDRATDRETIEETS